MYGYQINHNGRVLRYGDDPEDYLTDVLGGLAVDLVDDAARDDDPFFLYFALTALHLPAIPAPRHLGVFDTLEVPRSPAFNEADLSDKPAWLSGRAKLNSLSTARLDGIYRLQAEMLLAVDEMLASLVDILRARGELDSTYIVLTADHGLHFGEHRLVKTKLTLYTASAQVPLVVRGPGVAAHGRVTALTLLSDITPTLTDLAGVPAPAFVDGRSLEPWLRRDAARPAEREQVLLEFWPREGFPVDEREEPMHAVMRMPEYRALRSKRYLYTEYRYPDGSRERELYDLVRDPFELENIASSSDPALLRQLSNKLGELQRCRAERCRKAEEDGLEVAELGFGSSPTDDKNPKERLSWRCALPGATRCIFTRSKPTWRFN